MRITFSYDWEKNADAAPHEVVSAYLVAYREAITNAIVHREYMLESDIIVESFDDMAEIISPGGLPIERIRRRCFFLCSLFMLYAIMIYRKLLHHRV